MYQKKNSTKPFVIAIPLFFHELNIFIQAFVLQCNTSEFNFIPYNDQETIKNTTLLLCTPQFVAAGSPC